MTRFESLDADWLDVTEAVRRVLAAAHPLPPERVPLLDALGRALAEDVAAGATLPPFDNSAMDGYAVRGDDVRGAVPEAPVVLRVLGETLAGDLPGGPVGPGESVRIMTGAPLPRGADSVVRVEDTDAERGEEGRVAVMDDRDIGRHVRPAGQDMTEGDVVLRRGATVTPGVVAVLAATGRESVAVSRRPRIGVLSSGEELRGPDAFDEVAAGRAVPDTNGPSVAAALLAAGAEPVLLGVARDRPEDIRDRVRSAAGCDALVTSGGASMGEADLFKRVLTDMGLVVDFWRVRIRPGSPFSLARLPRPDGGVDLPILGLPGNPASSFVTFQVLVRPFVLALAGHARVHRRTVRAVAGERLHSTGRLTHFHRVVLEPGDPRPVARLTGPQGSGLVSSMGLADGLAVVPEGVAAVDEGDPVDVLLLDDGPAALSEPGYRGSALERLDGGAA